MLEKITLNDCYLNFLNKIENKKPFSFVRYGDGEWGAMIKNSQKHKDLVKKWGESIVDVGEELKTILMGESPKQDNYYLGIQPLSYKPHMFKNEIDEIVNGLNTCNADTLHSRNSKGEISEFLDSLQNRDVILVGPWYLKNLNLFKFTHVETQEYHAWLEIDDIKNRINTIFDPNKKQIILFSCSLAAKIIIDYFYREYDGNITQIDTGSLFDPYCGMYSRNYHINVINRLGMDSTEMMKPKIK
jgi:hypothetical protein